MRNVIMQLGGHACGDFVGPLSFISISMKGVVFSKRERKKKKKERRNERERDG